MDRRQVSDKLLHQPIIALLIDAYIRRKASIRNPISQKIYTIHICFLGFGDDVCERIGLIWNSRLVITWASDDDVQFHLCASLGHNVLRSVNLFPHKYDIYMTLYVYQSDDSLWVLLGIENRVPAYVYDYEIKNNN